MTIADNNLSEILASLKPSERRSVEAHLRGEKTLESREILRMLRRKLKKKFGIAFAALSGSREERESLCTNNQTRNGGGK